MFIIISFPVWHLPNEGKIRQEEAWRGFNLSGPKPSLNPLQMPLLNHSFKGLNAIMLVFLDFSDTQARVKAIWKQVIEPHLWGERLAAEYLFQGRRYSLNTIWALLTANVPLVPNSCDHCGAGDDNWGQGFLFGILFRRSEWPWLCPSNSPF